ncbi:Cyclin-dependent kinases regulatory subunit [Gryllus bimaculatus]|nr:Cyclin-dependent kinases regulatory subunit [Gryllus bimaculatus]
MVKNVPKTELMSEKQWRKLGVQQSEGWIHYMIHRPEPHILLFRRLKNRNVLTAQGNAENNIEYMDCNVQEVKDELINVQEYVAEI